LILITTYNRSEMLLSLLKEINGNVVVFDDGSEYNPSEHKKYCRYYRYSHQGKIGFWKIWGEMLRIAKRSKDDWFLFLQDDVTGVQMDKIKGVTKGLDTFAFNIMRRGDPMRGWTNIQPSPATLNGLDVFKCGYVDCIFSTNRKTLELLEWQMNPISPYHSYPKGKSSGVGEQLSQRFKRLDVPMYFPKKSLAVHGDHESKMHPNRKVNHMISQ